MTRSARSTWRRRLPTAPTTSSLVGRSGRRPIRALLPRRSRPRLRLFFLPSEKLLQQPLEMRMDRQLRAVKQDFVVPRDADGGEVLHFQLADLVGLVLDVDPAELGLREFPGEREEPGAVVDTGIAPLRAKAAHDQHA